MNDPLIGSQVAAYRIERVIGRGGMASVYFAWDTKMNRPVALKVMDERYRDTPAYVERFVREAQSIATWDQPNIVKVYDAGEEGGLYYYAMEFIRGLDLQQLLRQYLDARQLMPYNEVVRIGWAVANALDYAHAHGIVHRDIKPSNVLISVDGRVLLSDFGLVMNVNRGTMGETFGSPAYIAPEQARSSAGAVPQSDNYALGVMLYEMLTGQVPFYDSSPAALALKHLTEEPPRPRAINPRLNPSVEAVLLRALRKLPTERYATGREMMSALERALSGELSSPEANVPLPAGATVPSPAYPSNQPPATDAFASAASAATAAAASAAAASAAAAAASAANTRAGPSAQPRTELRSNAYPASPAATQVRGYAQSLPGNPAPGSLGSAGSPPYNNYPSSYPAAGGIPPSVPGQPRRRGFLGWGCLGALLAVVFLAVLAGAAFSVFQSNLNLPPELTTLWQVFFPPAPGVAIAPTLTVTATTRPSRTPPPSPTKAPSATPIPATPTRSPTLAPSALPPSTATLVPPTSTATSTSAPVYTMLLAQDNKQAGFVLKNTSPSPMPFTQLELYDTSNHLLVPSTAWGIDTLQPGDCVGMWVTQTQPGLPKGASCSIVGRLLAVAPDQVFWTAPLEIHYNGQKVAVCQPDQRQCTFDTNPQ